MVAMLLVRQQTPFGNDPGKQTFRVKNGPKGLPTQTPGTGGSVLDVLDFINNVYTTSVGASTLTAMLGSGLTVTPTLGLYITYPPNTNRPTPAGQFLADLIAGTAAGMKVTFEYQTLNGTNGFMLYLGPTPLFDDAFASYILLTENGLLSDINLVHIDNPVPDVGMATVVLEINKALGGGLYQYSIAVNGGAPMTQTVNYPAAPVLYSQIGWSGFEGDGENLFQTYLRKITVESLGTAPGPVVPGQYTKMFTSLVGNFLQVDDNISQAPSGDEGKGGPDERRESAVGKLKEWD